MKFKLLFIFSIFFVNIAISNKLDSLKNIYENSDNEQKISALISLGLYYSKSNYDSSMYFYNKAKELNENYKDDLISIKLYVSFTEIYKNKGENDKAFENLNKALELNKKIKDTTSFAAIYNYYGILYKKQGEYDTAIYFYEKAGRYYEEAKDKSGAGYLFINIGNISNFTGDYDKSETYYKKAIEIGKQENIKLFIYSAYNGLGVIAYKKGNFYKAIKYFQKSLEENELDNNLRGMSMCYNNIGMIHTDLQNNETAIEYYTKAYEIFDKMGDKIGCSNTYSNIGIIYNKMQKYDKAKEYYDKALNIMEDIGDKYELSNIYLNYGELYINLKDIEKAKYYLEKALKIKYKIDDKEGISSIYINLSDVYNVLGDSLKKLRYYKIAINSAKTGLKIAKEINIIPNQKTAYENLYKSYYNIGDVNNAYKYLLLYTNTKDSLFNEKKMLEIQSLEAKFENEKKKQEIEKNKILLAKKDVEAKQHKAEAAKQKILLYAFVLGFILALFAIILFINNIKNKRKANSLLTKQKNEIQEKNTELNQRNEEIKTQRDEIQEQKNHIEVIHNSLTESIDYAQNIQTSVMPKTNLIKANFDDFFVSFIPKDIVSGDFYWWSIVDNKYIIAAVDCTGHGVPGAFMSMLGISLLNEIVKKEKILSPDLILNRLREEVIISLKQREVDNNQKDGMDMSIISIDLKTKQLEFAGANNPLYLITENDFPEFNDKMIKISKNKYFYQIKADKMPISIYSKMKDFSKKSIRLNNGDCLYLFSDGYADQFGGSKGKRIMSKRFKQLFIDNYEKPMQKQKEILENYFFDWKKDQAQIDDVLIIGIKI